MNPLLQEAIASILRHILTMGAAYLVARGVWTEQSATIYVSGAALALIGIGWSLWQKHASRSVLVTALASSTPTTEDAMKARVLMGTGAQVTTPKDVIPQVATGSPYVQP